MNRFAAFDDSDEETKKVEVVSDKPSRKAAKAAKAAAAVAAVAPAATPQVPAVEAAKEKAPKSANANKKPSNKPKNDAPKAAPAPVDNTPTFEAPVDNGGWSTSDFGAGSFETPKPNTKGRKDDYLGPKKGHGQGVKNTDKIHHVTALENPSVKPTNRRHDDAHVPRGPRKPRPNKDAASSAELADAAIVEPPIDVVTPVAEDQGAWPSDEPAADQGAWPTEPETAESAPVVEKEPEPVRRTFDEYLQLREEARATSAILLATKPVRAVEDSFEGDVKVKREAVDLGVYSVTKEKKSSSSSKQPKVKNLFTDVAFNADEEPSSASTTRPNNNGFKSGGRGGGDQRRSPRSTTKIDISDSSAFPSL